MNRRVLTRAAVGLCFCLAVAAAANAPVLFFDKITMTDDLVTHYRWSSQFHDALAEGYLYPRWMPREHDGFGEPAFLYYAPLYFYLVSAFRVVVSDNWLAMKCVAFFTNAAAGFLAFLFCRNRATPGRALLGALAVQTAPLPFHLLHFQSLIPFHAALPFYVWAFSAAFRQADSPRYVQPAVALSTAALTLVHILSGFMLLACLAPCMGLLALRRGARDGFRLAAGWGLSVAVGLGLAAVYLLPALSAGDLVDQMQWFEPKYSDWRNSFGFPLLSRYWHGMRWFSVQWLIGLAALVPAACLGLAGWRSRRGPGSTVWLGTLLIAWIALFFSSELSYPLWANIESFSKVAFPYRYFMVASTAAFLGLACVREGSAADKLRVRALGAAGVLASLGLTALYFVHILRSGLPPEFNPLTLSTPRPHHVMNYFRTKGRGEGWRDYREAGGFHAHAAARGVRVLEESARSQERRMVIEASGPAELVFPLDAFPAWAVRIDGEPVEHGMDPATGLIRAVVPAGRHEIGIEWVGLPQQRAGRWISAGALILWLAAWVRRPREAGPRAAASLTEAL